MNASSSRKRISSLNRAPIPNLIRSIHRLLGISEKRNIRIGRVSAGLVVYGPKAKSIAGLEYDHAPCGCHIVTYQHFEVTWMNDYCYGAYLTEKAERSFTETD